jgi:hypothetical protein
MFFRQRIYTKKEQLGIGDSNYIFSRDYADQFGGEKLKILKTIKF